MSIMHFSLFSYNAARESLVLCTSKFRVQRASHFSFSGPCPTKFCHRPQNLLNYYVIQKIKERNATRSLCPSADTFSPPQNAKCEVSLRHCSCVGRVDFPFVMNGVRFFQTSSKSPSLPPQQLWQRIRIIEKYSKTPIRPLTLRKLLQANYQTNSAIIKTADWVRYELAIRFAHRLYDFHRLPFFALENPHIKEVYNIYVNTFERFIAVPEIKTMEDEQAFVSLIEEEKKLHDCTVDAMGEGAAQVEHVCNQLNLDAFLKRFFFFRIGRTVMIDHLIFLRQPTIPISINIFFYGVIVSKSDAVRASYSSHVELLLERCVVETRRLALGSYPDIYRALIYRYLLQLPSNMEAFEGWAGCIDLKCKPAKILEQRAEEAKESCRLSYGLAPPVCLSGNLSAECAFIPHHLSVIVIEILKNAMRATVEFHTIANSMVDTFTAGHMIDESDLPAVNVEVQKGKRDIIIKISDKGGGIRANLLEKIWSFGYTTVGKGSSDDSKLFPITDFVVKRDLAGYGFGLPLSRVFARYFGGDIHLQTCFGIGTDVYISLNHIGDQEEAIYFEEHRDLMNSHNLTVPPTSVLPLNRSSSSDLLSNPPMKRLIN
ncbi:ATPase/histidine kinase/Dna gyrase B/HSP90 domain-containing protein [Cardiosporidium cionae]|uniref:Protein-serine/threonine kinase n=1 Tax=Cardiosporidium cionae TaxID=476202 RepID=A0ABQ7J8M0_9APIC|nr:ATPase/histidine kinase/Dna gyrase B/HSP90 domain-containing protein [Cardiosporidium cionae]|eukprot:KAF8820274.1 ATPase/histidine kinase/Dna gyrase B/HSP90 domain-containing protein [Cardiosporidium cionae]